MEAVRTAGESREGSLAGRDLLVRFVDVDKSYDGESLVVAGLNLDVFSGEFLTLLGPSGSGKTTTLMMLAGFETPTRGTITIAGREITRVPPHKRGIGVVFQNYALFPHLDVSENLAFPLRARSIARAERSARVARALDMVQLGELGARMPGQLSGGQQQRVALARALIFEPSLVLMDEPLGALDKQLREHMQYEIKSLHERLGITFVYVTHDQGEALTMSNRVAVFNDGRIQQIAAPQDIYERPETAFVAQFIGENNRITGTVIALTGSQAEVAADDGTRLLCDAAPGLSLGDAVVVSIRPERLILKPGNDLSTNRLDATVRDVIYHGDHVRLRLENGRHGELVVKAPVRDAEGARAGTVVTVGWKAEDARALALL